MLNRNVLLLIFFFAKFPTYIGCTINENKVNLPSQEYDLQKPEKIILNDVLSEISGISFYPKDSSVFAISDESGDMFKILLNNRFVTEEWNFDKKRDFEDVVEYNKVLYVLESNGNIETLNFVPGEKRFDHRRAIFPGDNKKKNEFESLYYDEMYHGLIMICKDCEDDNFEFTTAYMYDPATDQFTQPVFKIYLEPIAKKLGIDKIKFRPSAATINPLTKDVWVLSSTNQLMVVIDRKGKMKDIYTLDPLIFNQPEGITFTPWGDLLIANEAGDKYNSATLLIFKLKK